MKYSVNRGNNRDGGDLENRIFKRKADAVKFAKRCRFYHIRLVKTRETVLTNI